MKRRPEKRRILIPLAVLLMLAGGGALSVLDPGTPKRHRAAASSADQHSGRDDAAARRAHERFRQAVALLQAGHHDYAAAALTDVLLIYPTLPEAHVNMGYALLGLDEPAAAARHFDRASDLRPSLHNAYYGLALAERASGNDAAALAAMQAFSHLADPDDRHLPRAQAFIWELQASTREASP